MAEPLTSNDRPKPPPTTGGTSVPPVTDDSDTFDQYSDTSLIKLYEELVKKNKFLESENGLFESFLNRAGTDASGTVKSADGTHKQNDTELDANRLPQTPTTAAANQQTRRRRKNQTTVTHHAPILLTPDQKSEIATRELEELRDEIENQKEEWNRALDNYRAEIEEIDIRIAEIKKAGYEFRRDIVQGAINERTGKVIAERWVRWCDERIKAKDAFIKKTRLKNATLKAQKNKLILQLKQKEEMGEVLHAIDFDQLQIENKQYLAKIEERNEELLKLKMTAGNTQSVLNWHKRKLNSLVEESTRLRREIASRQDMLIKLEAERQLVEKERQNAERVNVKIRTQMEDYRVPDVMEYVSIKAQQLDLTKRLKTWQRKCDIAKMQNARLKKIWNQMCIQLTAQAHDSRTRHRHHEQGQERVVLPPLST